MRIVMVSLMICAVAFLAGVAGDLSLAAPPEAAAAVHIAIPADAVRAHPLAPIADSGTRANDSHRAHHHTRAAHKPHRAHAKNPA